MYANGMWWLSLDGCIYHCRLLSTWGICLSPTWVTVLDFLCTTHPQVVTTSPWAIHRLLATASVHQCTIHMTHDLEFASHLFCISGSSCVSLASTSLSISAPSIELVVTLLPWSQQDIPSLHSMSFNKLCRQPLDPCGMVSTSYHMRMSAPIFWASGLVLLYHACVACLYAAKIWYCNPVASYSYDIIERLWYDGLVIIT